MKTMSLGKKVITWVSTVALALSMTPMYAFADLANSNEDPETPAQSASDGDDGEVVNNVLFTSINAVTDDSGSPIVSALTGEKLGTNIYIYNDNPNATAVAKVRLYTDQSSVDYNQTEVTPQGYDQATLGQPVLTLGETTAAGNATTITAAWNLLEKTDADNTFGHDVKYLEFEVPAGASVSFDMDFDTVTGYDSLITEQLSCVYKIANKNGEYPDTWTTSASETNDNGDAAEDGKLNLTWTGDWGWGDFTKTASTSALGYLDGAWAKGSQKIEYTFGATNQLADKHAYGVIYSKTVVVSDTLTLPSNVTLPTGAKASGNQVVTSAGDAIYTVTVDETVGGKVTKLEIVDTNKIELEVTYTNPDIEDWAWNPVSTLKTTIDTTKLAVDGTPDGTFTNEASVDVTSVESGDGTESKEKVLEYTDDKDAEVTVSSTGELDLSKKIDAHYRAEAYDSSNTGGDGWNVKSIAPAAEDVRGNDVLCYTLTISNPSAITLDSEEITDTLPAAFKIVSSASSLPKGYRNYSYYGYKVNKDNCKDVTVSLAEQADGICHRPGAGQDCHHHLLCFG